ncbi:MAG: pentapeptide repeat-containing protein [Pirellulaceae bacterium]
MNAAGRDLRGSRFVGLDLSGAVFDGCNLYGVVMYQCNLANASFRNVVFTGAVVGDCQVDGADFADATINGSGFDDDEVYSTRRLEISPEQLISTRSYKIKDLSRCVICASRAPPAYDFRRANLRHALFLNGDFTKCDFSDASLYDANFVNATLAFEQLASTADFRRRRFRIRLCPTQAILTGDVNFSGIDLDGSEFWNFSPDWDIAAARINGCTFRGGLSKTQLCSTRSYKEGDLSRMELALCDLSDCRLARINFTGARFGQCDFSGADLSDAVITGVDFYTTVNLQVSHGCAGLTPDQIRSTWNYKHDRMHGIALPEEVANALSVTEPSRAKPGHEPQRLTAP